MMKYLIFLILTVYPLFSSGAEATTFSILKEDTNVDLSWKAFGHDFSQAHLSSVTGALNFDPGNDRHDTISVIIPVSTLKASNALLTYQLEQERFFDVSQYQIITFRSTRVVSTGEDTLRIFGNITVKDITRPVIMEAVIKNEERKHGQKILVTASTSISRSAFGMSAYSGVVDDIIAVNLRVAAEASD